MKFMKNMERFCDIRKHSAGGFTLVELIVVIAILAILAGVGVPAYSGYVTQANKQADITLASEIENALMLAFYNGKLKPGASVVVYYDDKEVQVEGEGAEDAMVAAFGSGWKSLRLTHSGWAEEIGVVADKQMMEFIDKSTFSADTETLSGLLEDVQHVVGVFSSAYGSGAFDPGANLTEYLNNANVTVDKSNATAVANATVMYVADNLDNSLTSPEQKKAFAELWATFSFTIPEFATVIPNTSSLVPVSARFAFVEAVAGFVDSKTGTTNYVASLRDASTGSTDKSAINSAMATVYNDMGNAHTDIVLEYFGAAIENGAPVAKVEKTETRAYADAMAFVGYMKGVASSADSLTSSTDLTKENYYNDGTVLNYVTNYVSVGKVLQNKDVSKGAFVFVFDGYTVACMPLDY